MSDSKKLLACRPKRRSPIVVVRRAARAAGLALGIGLAQACATAPAVAPTVHVISEPPRDTFVCRQEPRGPRGMGPHGMGPRGMGPHGMGPRGPHGTGPRGRPMEPGGPPPPWPGPAPITAQPPAAPAPPGARGRAREPLAPTGAPLEIALARADAPVSGWETELRIHTSGAPLGAVLVEVGRIAHLAIVVSPEVAHRPVVVHADAVAAGLLVEQILESVDARLVRRDAVVLVGAREAIERRARERRLASIEVPPLETRVFAIGDRAHARELAQVYCHLHAGPRGAAATLGDDLVVTDTRTQLDQLEALVTSMHGAAQPTPPASTEPTRP